MPDTAHRCREIGTAVLSLVLVAASLGASGAEVVCPGHWHKAASTGPAPRTAMTMGYDAQRERVVLFGGLIWATHLAVDDTWEWDGRAWTQVLPAVRPPARYGAAMSYDGARGRTVLFSGSPMPGKDFGDTWTWDGATWTQVATEGPPARNNGATAYDSARRRTVSFGGNITFGHRIVQTWEWDGYHWHKRYPDGGLHPDGTITANGMAFDQENGLTTFVGGFCDDRRTWGWDGSAWRLLATDGPANKIRPVLAYDSARHRVVLYGGDGYCPGQQTPGETWEWDGVAWQRVATTGPGYRSTQPGFAYDRARGRVVLFGGQSPDHPDLGDTWTWLGPTYRCSNGVAGDLNCDGIVDRDDRKMVDAAHGLAACSPEDTRDLDHDGRITPQDKQLLVGLCSFDDCDRE